MKASDLTTIPDDFTRFVQAMRFLRGLEESQRIALKVRDISLLRLRKGDEKVSQSKLAEAVGLSQQRISGMEVEAQKRLAPKDTDPKFDEWIEDAQPIEI